MTPQEKQTILSEIERMLTFDGTVSTSYYIGKRDAERELKAFISSIPTNDYPMPEDTVIFQKGVAEGRRLEREDAEWSEEDEEMRKLLIAILEVNHPDGFFKANELGTTDMRGVHTEEIISWLKSPSAEAVCSRIAKEGREMSKRAEQRGLEAVPPRWRKTKDGKGKVDSALPVRKFYIRAYEQAEKDTIERAVAWLKEHAEDYIVNMTCSYPDAPFKAIIGGKCWENLKEYMENEQECRRIP